MRIIGSSPNRETKKYARKSPLQKRRLRKNGGAASPLFGSLGNRRNPARGVVPVARELSRFLSGFDHVRVPKPRDLRGAFVAATGAYTGIELGSVSPPAAVGGASSHSVGSAAVKHYVFVFFIAFLVVGAMFRWTGAARSVGSGPDEIAAWADGLMRAENARPSALGHQETDDLAYRIARREVEKLADAAALKSAAYALEAREQALHRRVRTTHGTDAYDRLDEYWCSLLAKTGYLIRYRLAVVGTAEAAESLVALFADPTFGYDGESSLNMGDALCVCGPAALPFLRRIVNGPRADRAREIEGFIERGERGI
jgi:hypothetical protein